MRYASLCLPLLAVSYAALLRLCLDPVGTGADMMRGKGAWLARVAAPELKPLADNVPLEVAVRKMIVYDDL